MKDSAKDSLYEYAEFLYGVTATGASELKQ